MQNSIDQFLKSKQQEYVNSMSVQDKMLETGELTVLRTQDALTKQMLKTLNSVSSLLLSTSQQNDLNYTLIAQINLNASNSSETPVYDSSIEKQLNSVKTLDSQNQKIINSISQIQSLI